jgi:hypothetical protein
MNLSLLQPAPISTLAWHILLETLEQGQVSAWISEFPECKVVADSQEAAIEALKTFLNQRMATVKVMPLQLSTENFEDPWLSLCGILKDDASFTEWSDRFWAEKQQNIEDDEILSVEESLSVM